MNKIILLLPVLLACVVSTKAQSPASQAQPGAAAVVFSKSGEAKLTKGDFNGAVADCTKAIALKPDMAIAYRNRSRAKLAIFQLPHAGINPLSKGYMEGRKKEYAPILADINTAIELEPGNAGFYCERADLQCSEPGASNWNRAIADYSRAIALKPNLASAYASRAPCRYQVNDKGGAMADWNMAIKLEPTNANYYYTRGWIKAHLAAPDFWRYSAVPGAATTLSEKEQLQLNSAIADYTKAIQLDPKLSFVYAARADAERAKGNVAGAKKDSVRSQLHHPRIPQQNDPGVSKDYK